MSSSYINYISWPVVILPWVSGITKVKEEYSSPWCLSGSLKQGTSRFASFLSHWANHLSSVQSIAVAHGYQTHCSTAVKLYYKSQTPVQTSFIGDRWGGTRHDVSFTEVSCKTLISFSGVTRILGQTTHCRYGYITVMTRQLTMQKKKWGNTFLELHLLWFIWRIHIGLWAELKRET